MTWRIQFIILIVALSSSCAKEETKKALIITVDELQPEETDVIISDLTIKDENSSPNYQSSESARILKRAPVDKKLDYIFVNPEDLKDLKQLQLDGVTIDKPKILRYPDSGSDESVESPSKYTPHSRSPEAYTAKGRNIPSKYPSRPAPPLTTHSVGESSKEKDTGQESPYLHKEYRAYASPDVERYKVPISENTPKSVGIRERYTAYRNYKPSNHPNPSSYSSPNTHTSPNPSAYSGYSGYSPQNYGNSNLQSYSGHSTYRRPNYEPYTYYAAPKPFGYPLLPSHYHPLPYAADKPNSYSGPSTYDIPKPASYHNPPIHINSKPNSYPEYNTYENSRPNSNASPQTYENAKPAIPSEYYDKPRTYTKSSVYEPSKPSSISGPSSHINSNPTYLNRYSYDNPEHSYVKSKPNSHAISSTYSSPSKTYSSSKTSGYSRPSSSSSPSSSAHDSSTEKTYPGSEKYTSHPEEYDYNEKTHTYDEYNPFKIPSEVSGYEKPRHYRPKKYTSKGYYDSPLVKHVSYDDLPTPYKHPVQESSYDHPHSGSEEDTAHDYGGSSKSIPRDEYYQRKRKSKQYNSNPSYEKEDKTAYDPSYKPKSTYNSDPYDDSHSSGPEVSYPSKYSYDTLKTTYGPSYEPPSYEEPVKSHRKYRYPSSKVAYESSPPYKNSHSASPAINDDYVDHAKYKSSHDFSSHDDNPPNYDRNPNVEYGSRYPISYRKTRHTDSKTPPTSHFTLEDARSQDNIHNYEKNPKNIITKSYSHYQPYDDSTEVQDHHSVKKNYSPVRPAPLHDQLHQPRYPPLPRRSKGDKTKKYYDEGEGESKESSESYKSEPSLTAVKSFSPQIFNNDHIRSQYYLPEHHNKRKVNPSSSDEIHIDHSSGTSSEETTEPMQYAKTSTVIYSKPSKDKLSAYMYSSDKPDKTSYKIFASNRSKKKEDAMKNKDFAVSQSEYSRIKPKSSYNEPDHFVHSFSYKSGEKAINNTSFPESSSSLSETFPQKRVPGVVHRSRHAYPSVTVFKRQKGYLPYKPHYTKSIHAYDNKPYESIPPEIREKNSTSDILEYDLSKKILRKSNNRPHKKYKQSPASVTKDHSKYENEKSSHHAIPGEPGRDYPVLKEIPYNKFSCDGKLPGFYADVDSRCQVYYQCSEEGRLQSFLCPNGTIFNQLTFVCEWWHNVDCSKSEKYFGKNNELYKLSNPSSSMTKSKRTVNVDYDQTELDIPSSYEESKYYGPENEDFRYREIDRH